MPQLLLRAFRAGVRLDVWNVRRPSSLRARSPGRGIADSPANALGCERASGKTSAGLRTQGPRSPPAQAAHGTFARAGPPRMQHAPSQSRRRAGSAEQQPGPARRKLRSFLRICAPRPTRQGPPPARQTPLAGGLVLRTAPSAAAASPARGEPRRAMGDCAHMARCGFANARGLFQACAGAGAGCVL